MSLEQLSYLNVDAKFTPIFINKFEMSIQRIIQFAPTNNEPYYVAFSGGKDSEATLKCVQLSGVPHQVYYNRTGIDPPELVIHIRNNHPNIIWNKPKINLWEGIAIHGMPIRRIRWCCDELKEHAGSNRRIITGVRWQESSKRATRKMVEFCQKDKTKIFVNPIIDWTDKDVWQFIKAFNIPYCSLYDEVDSNGNKVFKRLGCVLCPMTSAKQAIKEYNRWPKLGEAWHRACLRRWENKHNDSEYLHKFNNGEEYWQHWLSRKGEPKVDKAQCIMFGT